MGHFETLAEVLGGQYRGNLLTAAAIYSTVELIEGEIVSFYADFPRNNHETAEGRLVVVTTDSIVETTIQLPKEWQFFESSATVETIEIESKRVSVDSVVEISIKSTPRYWNPEIQKRDLSNVEVSVKTLSGQEFIIVYPNRVSNDNPRQNLDGVLKVLKSKCSTEKRRIEGV